MIYRPSYFVTLPGFAVVEQVADHNYISGEDTLYDISKVVPVRLDLSTVIYIGHPNYSNPSSVYYRSVGEPYPQKGISCLQCSSGFADRTIWVNLPYDEMFSIHDKYLRQFNLQQSVPDFFKK